MTTNDAEYQWFVDHDPDSPTLLHGGGQTGGYLVSMVVFTAGLALPPVTRATGVSWQQTIAIMSVFMTCGAVLLGFRPLARRSRLAFQIATLANLAAGLGVCLAFIGLGGEPRSPLWSMFILHAAVTGSMAESRPSLVLLLLHVLGPLAALAFFRGHDSPWAVAGPVFTAAFSGGAFHYLASRTASWRRVRADRDAALAELREKQVELDRLRLARDLHDSVGSALGLLRISADLLEREAEHPDEIRRLSGLIRDGAAGGLDDLRGTLEALAPQEPTLGALGTALETLARRVTTATVRVAVGAGAAVAISPEVRLALVRVFQEFVRNALEHGGARHAAATLSAARGGVVLALEDDGRGFDPATIHPGRGLAGMRRRAQELGGTFALDAAPGRGTRATLELPAVDDARASSLAGGAAA